MATNRANRANRANKSTATTTLEAALLAVVESSRIIARVDARHAEHQRLPPAEREKQIRWFVQLINAWLAELLDATRAVPAVSSSLNRPSESPALSWTNQCIADLLRLRFIIPAMAPGDLEMVETNLRDGPMLPPEFAAAVAAVQRRWLELRAIGYDPIASVDTAGLDPFYDQRTLAALLKHGAIENDNGPPSPAKSMTAEDIYFAIAHKRTPPGSFKQRLVLLGSGPRGKGLIDNLRGHGSRGGYYLTKRGVWLARSLAADRSQ